MRLVYVLVKKEENGQHGAGSNRLGKTNEEKSLSVEHEYKNTNAELLVFFCLYRTFLKSSRSILCLQNRNKVTDEQPSKLHPSSFFRDKVKPRALFFKRKIRGEGGNRLLLLEVVDCTYNNSASSLSRQQC